MCVKRRSMIFYRGELRSISFDRFILMRESEKYVDFKITFKNRTFIGHRVILAAAMPYFHALLFELDEEHMPLLLQGIDPDVLASVFDYAYRGKIEITSENVRSLLSAAEHLKLEEVCHACTEFLGKELDLSNVWDIRNLGQQYGDGNLIKAADLYIKKNFEMFSGSPSFLALPFLYLKEIISSDNVRVSTEENVFEAVIRWIKVSPNHRRYSLRDLLAAVRMSQLSPEYLARRVSTEELVRTCPPCRDLVAEAKQYHLRPERKKSYDFVTRPRIYEEPSSRLPSETNDTHDYSVYAICRSNREHWIKHFNKSGKWIDLSIREFKFQESLEELIELISNFRIPPRHIITAVAYNRIIYVLSVEGIMSFNIETLEWQQLDTLDERLYTSGIVFHGNSIYFLGGQGRFSDSIHCFDAKRNKWLQEEKMPRGVRCSAVTSMSEFVYITGGVSEDHSTKCAERYKPETKEWNEISPMLSKRSSHSCSTLNGKIYVCGGTDDDIILDTAEMYDPMKNQWHSVHSMTSPRGIVSLVSHNNKLFATRRDNLYRQDIQIYDSECNKWKYHTTLQGDTCLQVFLVRAEVLTEREENDVAKAEDSAKSMKKRCLVNPQERLQRIDKLKNLGNTLYNRKKHKEASETYAAALNSLEKFLLRRKEIEDDFRELEKIRTPLLLNLSQCKLLDEDYCSVIANTSRVLQGDPDNVKGLYRRAKAYVGVGDFDKAQSDFRRTLELDLSLASLVRKELEKLEELRVKKRFDK